MTPDFRLNLALQGGGSHGAFTWGVLDALLADGRLQPDGVSGASAGAMNAVALAQGWMDGGADGARSALRAFWGDVAASMPAEAAVLRSDGRGAALAPLAQLALQWTRWLSPAQANPLDLNPLREVVNRRFDFERLRRESPLRLCISATEVATGAARCFSERDLSADALLASACLPSLFRPVVIAGEALWDGGYSANPPVQALLASTQARHTLLVLLNPQRHPHTPTSAEDIRAHAQDLGFSAGLEAELRNLAQWQDDAPAPSGWQVWRRWSQGPATQRLSGARFHCIDGGQALADWHPTSRLAVHAEHFEQLFRLGREHAQAWLAQALGPKGLSGRRLSALWAPPAGAPGAR